MAGHVIQPENFCHQERENRMSSIIYIVGLVVVVIAVLSFFGLR